jgi:two-component system, chemotaxis family, chemotaxis protein CheY
MFPSTTRILIVDDVQMVRALLITALDACGLSRVTEATNGVEGIEQIEQAIAIGKPFELVISDWNMPKMNGLELLRKVREKPESKDVPFLLLTTENEKGNVLQAVAAGASHYIVKPVNAETLRERLAVAYKKHFPNAVPKSEASDD